MIEITVDGVAYEVPSSAADTNWAAKQVAFEQALATAVNEAVAAPTWTTLTLINSWALVSVAPAYWVDPNGRLWFRGGMATGASGSAPWNPLPVGARPPHTVVLPLVVSGGFGLIQVTATGVTTVSNYTAGSDVSVSTILESVNFSTA